MRMLMALVLLGGLSCSKQAGHNRVRLDKNGETLAVIESDGGTWIAPGKEAIALKACVEATLGPQWESPDGGP